MRTATEQSLPLHDWTAAALAAAYRCRALSPVEVTRAVLDHIAQWEPQIRATYLLRPQLALESARASEMRWLKNAPLSALDGVPFTLKENIATQGDRMPRGTRATDSPPALRDAPVAARMREAGAVLLCKTTMPDYGMLSSAVSSFHPLTRNPWDVHKSPGGSSAGAAAAAAAGYGPLHVGNDVGGSLRLPASWCGIFSLKPSLGRIPIDPPYTGMAAGPMTRSVGDAALLMQALSWPDERDSMSLPFAAIDWNSFDTPLTQLDGVRIGLLMDAGCGLPVEPEVQFAVRRAALLLESAGAIVTPMQPFLTQQMLDGMEQAWRMHAHQELAALSEARRAMVLPYIRAWSDSAADLSGSDVFAAMSQFHATRVATVQACNAFDYVITPTAPIAAMDAALPSPCNDPLQPPELIALTVPFNMSEQPAASINCGYTKTGLPIGLQIAGRRFDDLGVLQLCRAFEVLRGPQRPWPDPPSL